VIKKIIDSEKIYIKREKKEGKTVPNNRTPLPNLIFCRFNYVLSLKNL